MIHCSTCGKPLDKVPLWMDGVQVEFICNNCPGRDIKSIAEIKLEPIVTEEKDAAEKEVAAEADDKDEE